MGIAGIIARECKREPVSDQSLSHVSKPFVVTACVAGITFLVVDPLDITPSCYHAACDLAQVYERSLAIITAVSTHAHYHPPLPPLPP